MNSTPEFTLPANEPELAYAEGSAELAQLYRHLSDHEAVEIPAVIGGQKFYSNNVEELRAPHDRARVLARVHLPTAQQVRQAIQTSMDVAADWASTPFADRAAIMHRAAAIVSGRMRHRINAATMLGQSKTIEEAEPDSACELVDFLRFNTYNARHITESQPTTPRASQNRTDWRPLEGFVYAVSPFNFTAIGTNLTCAPALMGNVVLWKPSNKSTLANYIFFEALEQAGLPPGVINFVPGEATMVTDAVLGSEHFAGLHFTGSSEVFRSLWQRVGNGIHNYRTFPRLVGETGGKDFVLAHRSADAAEVAIALVRGAFGYQGQKCSAASRAYIPRSLWPKVSEQMKDILSGLKVGDVADRSTYMGAVIDKHSYTKISGYLKAAKSNPEVSVVSGGGFREDPGFFIDPTVLRVENPRHTLMCDELFGPVLTVHVYDDNEWDSTLSLIDSSTKYALTGSIFCTERKALRQSQDVLVNAAGNLYINDKPTGAVVGQQPFGGGRSSGTNDKAGSWMNLLRWTSPRVVKETYAPPRVW
jgi:1-pyrroline-5-carboxylate dehydrogenase